MSKSKMSCTQWVTGVGIELSQTLVWTAKKTPCITPDWRKIVVLLCKKRLLLLFCANYPLHHNSWQAKICRHGTILQAGHDRYWTFCLRRTKLIGKSTFLPPAAAEGGQTIQQWIIAEKIFVSTIKSEQTSHDWCSQFLAALAVIPVV